MDISLRYRSIDGARSTRSFTTLFGAQKWAHARVGAHPEIGTGYAVSADGIGKLTIQCGTSYPALFPAPVAATPYVAPAPRVKGFTADALEELRTVLEKQERHGAECHILVDCLVCYHLVQREADARKGFEFLPLA